MDNKKNGIPKLRFPGFTGAWEQRKLGEVATRVTRKNKNLESTLPLTISAQLGLVDQISYFDKRIASSNLTNYILLNRGEFAYNKSYSNGYPFGAVKRLNRYDKGVIPSLYIAFMPNTIFINSDFMEMYFETSLWHKEVSARASEGARNHGLLNISPSDFMDIYMEIPEKIEEQKKIAKFLEDFDSLIALHQRKLEHLQEQKKGLLQKMFPKNGETVPEVRFPGFTDAWEQRKLGEVFDTVTDYVANGSFKSLRDNVKSYTKENYAYMIRLQDASNNWKGPWLYTDEAGYSFLTKSKLHPNDIIMSNVGSVGKFFLIPELDKPMTLAPNAVLIKSSKNNALFLYQMMISTPMQVAVGRKTTPGVQLKINKTDFKRIQTNLPSLNEQEKIGEFFKQLDSLIALHQRKLEHLELMKKGLLQQMFV
ncbi:restriction endonuclease subunit S [Ligilactobacillus salivarius]|uniref:restriction endonuclease subunit S n=1 Tax=Ligilactobacillus salivarius TaxID=1624 RepID=UPI0021059DC0|nr:restriction endonuclease subunit S [Ligilactobacillus salivarius]UTX36833.1 restriction endonuclease subunit S [Ligilactobacillus salivarius]